MTIPGAEFNAFMAHMERLSVLVTVGGLIVIGLGLLVERLPAWARVAVLAVMALVMAEAFALAQEAILTPCVICNMEIWPVWCWIWWC